VLGMGLTSMVVLLLRSSRVDEAAHDAPSFTSAAPASAAVAEPEDDARGGAGTARSGELQRACSDARLRSLARLLESFETWWSGRGDDPPWPGFDRWLRDTLHELGGARRVRCFHVQAGERNAVGAVEPRL